MSKDNDLTLLGEALRERGGPLMDFVRKRKKNPEIWDPAFERFLRGENPWQEVKRRMKVLRELEQITEFPGTDVFKVADYLWLTPDNERATAELVIGYLYNIGDNFLDKIEKNVVASKLRAWTLKKDSRDDLIIADLGGEEAAESTVAEMIALMRAQGRGQKGILLTNGYSNIFYIRDAKGVLWAVRCRWRSDGRYWYVSAYPLSYPNACYAGDQVFSRNSSGT